MSLNFVRVSWSGRMPTRKEELLRKVLQDKHLDWAAKGLGAYLATNKEAGVRFPNSMWDGTMWALDELKREGYIFIEEIQDAYEPSFQAVQKMNNASL